MRKLALVAILGLLAVSAAAADKQAAKPDPAKADKDAVMKTVHRFIDSFNQGDVKSAVSTCASPAAVIDEFPPFTWAGPNACGDWAKDYDAAAKQMGMTEGKVWMGTPTTVDVAGDRAYVIAPTKFRYKLKGKPVNEPPARLTVALHKQGSDWKIVAWTWSKS